MTSANQEDSYQQYRKYLEQSLGALTLTPPTKPMNPFMRYFFERGCEQRSKGNKDWKKITKQSSEEWKHLPAAKKSYYEKMYQIRMKERNQLFQEYLTLTKKKKPATAYCRFFKKRYTLYAKEHPTYHSKDITKLINNDWKSIGEKEKAKLQKEYQDDKILFQAKRDDSKRIDQYALKAKAFLEDLQEQKQKIMKKYGITSTSLAKQHSLKQKEARQKKQLLKKKEKEQRQRKLNQEKQKLKKQREEQKQKEKLKIQQEKENAKKQLQAKKPQVKTPPPKTQTVKKQAKVPIKKAATKTEQKKVSAKVSPAKKTKQIKKAPKKAAVVKTKVPQVKIQAGKKQSKPAKKAVAAKAKVVKSGKGAKAPAKGKAVKKAGGKRGKK